jgi:hypothetical protein
VRKLLVDREAITTGASLQGRVREVYHRGGPSSPVTRLSSERIADFLGMGIRGPNSTLRVVAVDEAVKTPLGKFVTRHMTAEGVIGKRTLEYQGWLTDRMPFGCAQFEVRERGGLGPARLVFHAEAARSGKGARSELDESRAR